LVASKVFVKTTPVFVTEDEEDEDVEEEEVVEEEGEFEDSSQLCSELQNQTGEEDEKRFERNDVELDERSEPEERAEAEEEREVGEALKS